MAISMKRQHFDRTSGQVRLANLHRARMTGIMCRSVSAWDNYRERFADGFEGTVAEQLLGRAIPRDDQVVRARGIWRRSRNSRASTRSVLGPDNPRPIPSVGHTWSLFRSVPPPNLWRPIVKALVFHGGRDRGSAE